jgi:hypothetical protein
MGVFLIVTRNLAASSLFAVFVQAIGAALIYAGLFLSLAIGSAEREWYVAKIRQVFGLHHVRAA